MSKIPLGLLLLVALGAFVAAQPPCRKRLYFVQAGEVICERQCITRPRGVNMECARARISTRVLLCPPNCCRRGSDCMYLTRA